MCGIAGWIDWDAAPADPRVLARMNDAIAHRGPDGEGTFFGQTRDGRNRIGLAHRRLAIIDLDTGAQPMHSADGAVTIVFNGEIYNFRELREELRARQHRFLTASDTEVIIAAYREWGPDSVSRLRGMFAFALWDRERERLVLARDPFGKKPLYLCRQPTRLIFGSEIKAVLAHPAAEAALDRQSVLDYLQYRYVPGPNTLFRGVVKLDPGNYAVWQDGQLSTTCYYRPPDGNGGPQANGSDADPVPAFLAALDEAVRLRMVADVPFGAFLSGGIDSSAIVALMSRHSDLPINTFSVGFNEVKYSETGYARQVAARFKTNHHELIVAPEDIISRLPDAIGFRDAPFAETADVPIWMLSQEAAKSVKMVLSGEGSDEILAGYPKHKYEPYVAMYQRAVPALLHDRLIEPLVDLLPYRFYRVRTLAHSFGLRDPMERLPRWFGALDIAERDELVALDVPPRPVATRPFARACRSPLRRMLYFDQTSWLSDNLLERGDRMTMAASIEARMPFMDTKLAAFVSRHKDSCRIRFGEDKWLLRRAMAPILPADILHRAKVGFRVPVNLWFQTVLKDYVRDLLLGPQSLTRDYYRRDNLIQVLDQHIAGQTNHEKLIWSLMNLELFQRRYRLAW
jgi:asparagine synthase (glutamine-hydrolysing)